MEKIGADQTPQRLRNHVIGPGKEACAASQTTIRPNLGVRRQTRCQRQTQGHSPNSWREMRELVHCQFPIRTRAPKRTDGRSPDWPARPVGLRGAQRPCHGLRRPLHKSVAWRFWPHCLQPATVYLRPRTRLDRHAGKTERRAVVTFGRLAVGGRAEQLQSTARRHSRSASTTLPDH